MTLNTTDKGKALLFYLIFLRVYIVTFSSIPLKVMVKLYSLTGKGIMTGSNASVFTEAYGSLSLYPERINPK